LNFFSQYRDLGGASPEDEEFVDILEEREGAPVTLALPSGPSAPIHTKQPHPAPLLSSTEPFWSPSICATWPKRCDCVICKDVTKTSHVVASSTGSQASPPHSLSGSRGDGDVCGESERSDNEDIG